MIWWVYLQIRVFFSSSLGATRWKWTKWTSWSTWRTGIIKSIHSFSYLTFFIFIWYIFIQIHIIHLNFNQSFPHNVHFPHYDIFYLDYYIYTNCICLSPTTPHYIIILFSKGESGIPGSNAEDGITGPMVIFYILDLHHETSYLNV